MMSTKIKVLIIDDDPSIRELYENRFRKAGFQVSLASNGDEGIQKALEERPSVILSDLMMPAKGGLGVAEVLKTMPETRDIPLVIITAFPSDEYRDKSARIGAAQFISKSETMPAEVVEIVQKLATS